MCARAHCWLSARFGPLSTRPVVAAIPHLYISPGGVYPATGQGPVFQAAVMSGVYKANPVDFPPHPCCHPRLTTSCMPCHFLQRQNVRILRAGMSLREKFIRFKAWPWSAVWHASAFPRFYTGCRQTEPFMSGYNRYSDRVQLDRSLPWLSVPTVHQASL